MQSGMHAAGAGAEAGPQTPGSAFRNDHIVHGEANAIYLPFVIRFKARLSTVAANAIGDACTGSNPSQPSQKEMDTLLMCCYTGTPVDC